MLARRRSRRSVPNVRELGARAGAEALALVERAHEDPAIGEGGEHEHEQHGEDGEDAAATSGVGVAAEGGEQRVHVGEALRGVEAEAAQQHLAQPRR